MPPVTGEKMRVSKSKELTADGAAKVAAMLTDTIARERLRTYSPESIEAFVLNTFRDCLNQLRGHQGHAASLEQIIESRNPSEG